jgi:peptidoglycan hydrolase CwlO-like protein
MSRITIIMFSLATLLFVISCSTTGFAGLAKESYAADIEQKTTAEIQTVKDDVKKIKAITDQLESLLKDMEETKKTTKEFKDSVKNIEEQIKSMPRENVAKLVEILQKYLNETK